MEKKHVCDILIYMDKALLEDLCKELASAAAAEHVEKLVVGAFVVDKGRLLILQRKSDDFLPDVYETPGGGVEPRETIPHALARELAEETGLRLSSIGEYLGHIDYIEEHGRPARQFNFTVKVGSVNRIVHPEHLRYAWVSEEELSNYKMTGEMLKSIKDFFARRHD